MAQMLSSRPSQARRDGFTLIEVVISIMILGIVAATVSAAFIVIVRTSPASEARTDDARALLGLTNWLPLDVASTDENEFALGDNPSSCTGVPASIGLLELQWSDSSTYVANYRFVPESSTSGRLIRFTCVDGQPAASSKLSSTLSEIGGAPPIAITLFPNGAGGHTGLEFVVDVIDPETNAQRELISLRAFTANVRTTLPATTTTTLAPAVTTTSTTTTTAPNQPPVAAMMWMNVYDSVATNVSLPASDPEGQPLTLQSIDTTPYSAVELSVTPSGGLDASVTATAGGPYSFAYTVVDNAGATASGIVNVNVVVSPTPTTTSTTTTSTTSTTSTTTTTTTIPCTATITSVIPSTVQNTGASNGNVDVGPLKQDVVVTISKNGSCGSLVLGFDPDPDDSVAVQETISFGGANSVTIGKDQYTNWRDTNGSPDPLQVRVGANGPVLNSASLRVT